MEPEEDEPRTDYYQKAVENLEELNSILDPQLDNRLVYFSGFGQSNITRRKDNKHA